MCSVLGSRVSALATSPAVTSWARCQCAVTRPSRHEGPSSPKGDNVRSEGPTTAEDARLVPSPTGDHAGGEVTAAADALTPPPRWQPRVRVAKNRIDPGRRSGGLAGE